MKFLHTNHRQRLGRQALLELPMLQALFPQGAALAIFLSFALTSPLLAADSDPLENVNRVTHEFNQGADKILFKPLAKTYQTLLPQFVRSGVRNLFNNLDDVRVAANDIFQMNFSAAASDLGRLAVNSTIGVGGLIEVADPLLGLEKNQQDFGKTLAHYGVEPGPYLVLPLIGPSTVRDAFGLGLDSILEPVRQVDHVSTRNALLGTEATDFRAQFLNFDGLITGDDYLFIREAYLQRRDFNNEDDLFAVAFD